MASPNTSTSFNQTLGSITQALDGYQLYNAQLAETASGSLSAPYVHHDATQTETVFAFDQLSVAENELLTDVANASDTLTPENFTNLSASATASESFDNSSMTTTLSNTGFAGDTLTVINEILLTSVVQAADTQTLATITALNETASASETLDPGIVYNQLEVGSANATDVISTGQIEVLVDSANATNTLAHSTTVAELLSDAANAIDTQTNSTAVVTILVNTATGTEAITFAGSVYNETLSYGAQVKDLLWAKDLDAIAWVLNTESGGLTNYDNFGFDSIAFHKGVLYATSPEGLFALNAADDDGRSINAVAKGGFLDFGAEEKKHISDIYVGYTGGSLECDVETYDGAEDVYTYEMEQRDADAPRNNRLKVGRGLSSRYWRFSFRNVAGADFQIHDVAVNVAVSKRRL